MASIDTRKARQKRHTRVRAKVKGTATRPRLSIFRSVNHIYAQVIDDSRGHTLVQASSRDADLKKEIDGKNKVGEAELVGALVAKRAQSQGIKQVVFDRGGFQYHGRVRALAEAARKEGLVF